MIDVGLFLLRVAVSALLAGHALQKLAGWFQGMGPAKTAELFETWGFRPGRPMVVLAATCELVGAVLILTGLATPMGCAIVIGTMIVAASPNAANGLWAHLGGCEVPVLYAIIAAFLALAGPGLYSLDHVLSTPIGGWPGIAAIALGVLASVPPLIRRRAALRT